jgi:hypothetical protein
VLICDRHRASFNRLVTDGVRKVESLKLSLPARPEDGQRRFRLLARQPAGKRARQFLPLRRLVDRRRQQPVGRDADLAKQLQPARLRPQTYRARRKRREEEENGGAFEDLCRGRVD